jgi:hypothetical protein
VTIRLTEGRMFAALSATNEAILKTDAPEELFQRVCDAAVHGGGFKAAGRLLPQSDSVKLFIHWMTLDDIWCNRIEPTTGLPGHVEPK